MTMRRSIRGARRIAVAVGLLGLCSCGNGASSPAPAVPIDVAASSKLQFGVGTARINTTAGSFVGTNFTMTFRGADGNNATGVNVPTITGPPSFAIGFAGSRNSIHGLSQTAFANDVTVAGRTQSFPVDFQESLGPYAGVFGYGMADDNQVSSQLSVEASAIGQKLGASFCTDLQSSGDPTQAPPNVETSGFVGQPNLATGTAVSSEIGLPLGAANVNASVATCTSVAASVDPLFENQTVYPINYYGGPPAWPSPQGYGAPSYFIGFGLGFTDTPAAPVSGTYQLNVAYPTSADYSTSSQITASAQLRTIDPLPLMPQPALAVNADGTGVVTLTIPPGLLETIVEIRTTDCRNPNDNVNPANNFSQVVHAGGLQTVIFAANLGPPDSSGVPSRTFCSTPFTAIVSALGFDYPAYESSYPFDDSVAPKITNGDGHTGQADVTVSPPLMYSPPVPQALRRRFVHSKHA